MAASFCWSAMLSAMPWARAIWAAVQAARFKTGGSEEGAKGKAVVSVAREMRRGRIGVCIFGFGGEIKDCN